MFGWSRKKMLEMVGLKKGHVYVDLLLLFVVVIVVVVVVLGA